MLPYDNLDYTRHYFILDRMKRWVHLPIIAIMAAQVSHCSFAELDQANNGHPVSEESVVTLTQNTLSAEAFEQLYGSQLYKKVVQLYSAQHQIATYVLPNQTDTILHFQLVTTSPIRMHVVHSLAYSGKTGILYEYDTLADTLRQLK